MAFCGPMGDERARLPPLDESGRPAGRRGPRLSREQLLGEQYPPGRGRARNPRLDLYRRVRQRSPDRLCADRARRGDLCLSRRCLCARRASRTRCGACDGGASPGAAGTAGAAALDAGDPRCAWLVRIARMVAHDRPGAPDAASLPRRLSSAVIISLRPDLAIIADNVAARTRILDIGCADGALMAALRDTSGVDARGLELDAANVAAAVSRGLSVIQGDADSDLADYPDASFDYAILSQTLQTTRRPDLVLDHLLRIGQRAFVSFPNFAHWRVRA